MNWTELNTELRRVKDEARCLEMYAQEQAGESRRLWLNRIYSRFSALRRKREQLELRVPRRKSVQP
jgi:hypothetical protein